MNKLRNTLVIAAVMGIGSSTLARNETSLTVFPDVGAWQETTRKGQNETGQEVQLASLVSTSTSVSAEAAKKERQFKAALEALGIAVD